MAGNDLRTKALVLRRTNYGETDRILNLLTPEGKLAVLAKGVRREKSRLAGGIEMFCLSEVVVHQGRSQLGTLTSSKMLEFYQNILTDLPRLELASEVLKQVSRAAEQADSPEYFKILSRSLSGLHAKLPVDLVAAWAYLNLVHAKGEQVNLLTDVAGQPLEATSTYAWNSTEQALQPLAGGQVAASHIKLMRLMLATDLTLVARVNQLEDYLPEVLHIAKSLAQL